RQLESRASASGFAGALELGILDASRAAEVRAEGERVLASRPWPTGVGGWRPPRATGALDLPVGWDVVEEAQAPASAASCCKQNTPSCGARTDGSGSGS